MQVLVLMSVVAACITLALAGSAALLHLMLRPLERRALRRRSDQV